MSATVLHGDCLDTFRDVFGLASIVSDPPGGGSFMGLAFDGARGGRDAWIKYMAARFTVAREATVPGSWGLFWAFGRTAHWTACALDDAGWEIVRPILHVHGQGWPKGRSQLKPAQEVWWLCRWGPVTSLQIDRCRVRRSWAERPASWFESGHTAKPDATKIGGAPPGNGIDVNPGGSWPPDLLLSHCPSCRRVGSRAIASSNFSDGGPRKHAVFGSDHRERPGAGYASDGTETAPAWECLAVCSCGLAALCAAGGAPMRCPGCGEERWWACPVADMDGQSGETRAGVQSGARGTGGMWSGESNRPCGPQWGDSGGASRFFPVFHYDAKASSRERQAGCEWLLWVRDSAAGIGWRRVTSEDFDRVDPGDRVKGNPHATIKPIGCGEDDGLMRWLVRLVTPERGRVGDLWCGSGSTLVAAQIEEHDSTGGDADSGAVDIVRARLAFWTPERHRIVLRDASALKAAEQTSITAECKGQFTLPGLG